VLFADVVHSMDIAATVGAERLREIMAHLVDKAAAVVKRYGGTVDKFTGDGIMAVFGAPVALEDHAVRACLAALAVEEDTKRLAVEVRERDGAELQLRVGLNSGQVIAGEIGSGPFGYTAVGEQVGIAQRMESVAPPGGVMLSESTARLVDNAVVLGDLELVQIKGSDVPVAARRLLAIAEHQPRRRGESTLIGRTWELNTITGILDEAIGGAGCVVNIRGPAGIGKSRLVRESATIAAGRGVPVVATYCESHTRDIPFYVVAGLLRAAMDINDLDPGTGRTRVRDRFPNADPEDLLLLEDLLAIRDTTVALPDIAADARRRRLTALVNAASLALTETVVYVIEDVHWIDEASESMLAEFLAVIPQTPSLVLITYRPEYRGALAQVSDAQTMALRPLNEAQASALTAELLGSDPSTTRLAELVAARAAGNPFFAEEMVRDLAERGVLHGASGAYLLRGNVDDASVPATLQATIGARIDRLDSTAKHTLNAAAVIGSRFDADLLGVLVDNADMSPLMDPQLVDQVRFTPGAEYAFRHPMIRTVAYESQLKSDRAHLHRRLAAAIETRGPADENAALIAEHLEAAGDLHAAYAWHMRAGSWAMFRDIAAAWMSWRKARQVGDRLPSDDPGQLAMRIEPRTLLCGTAYRFVGGSAEARFDELRDLCTAAGDQRSLAIGMAGMVTAQAMNREGREASQLAMELLRLLESIGDSTWTVGLSFAAMGNNHTCGEMAANLQLAQRVIDLANGDPTMGNLLFGSPLATALAFRGAGRCCLNIPGWQSDFQHAHTMARAFHPAVLAATLSTDYLTLIVHEVRLPDATAMRDADELLSMTEQSADDFSLDMAQAVRAFILARRDGPECETGLGLLAKIRAAALETGFYLSFLPVADIAIARGRARSGDLDGAVELSRAVVDDLLYSGLRMWIAPATAALAEALLRRGGYGDLQDAQSAIDRLAAVPTDPGFVMNDIWLLRLHALLDHAAGDEDAYRDYRNRYRDMARTLGFEGHTAWAEAMP
jgi:adenylate cyclase